jgi:hypothetical protein
MTRVRILAGVGNFSLHPLTGTGAQSASYPVVTDGSFDWAETDHSLPASDEVKNAWSYISTR